MADREPTTLTRLESEVMRAVWQADPDPVRVRDVVDALNDGRVRPLAYNTVQTVLTILRDKGVVEVMTGSGRAHLYRALVSHDDASRDMVGDLVERLFGGRVQPLLHQLVTDPDVGEEDLRALRQWVETRLRDAEGEA